MTLFCYDLKRIQHLVISDNADMIVAKNKDSPNTKAPIAIAINTFDMKSFILSTTKVYVL